MDVKKYGLCIVISILCLMCLVVGCQKGDKEKTIKIVWQSEQQMKMNEEYLNRVLREKGYPYEVTFVTERSVNEGENIDLLETGIVSWEKPYDTAEAAKEGRIIPLDEYFATEKGERLKETLPDKVWEAYRINGKLYTVLSVGFIPCETVYIWNQELAQKYDIHPEVWDGEIWNYKEELLRIQEGEQKENADFVVLDGLAMYENGIPDFTKVLGISFPIIVRESDEDIKAQFLYETPEFRESMGGIQKLYEAGLCKNGFSGTTEPFLTLDTLFMGPQERMQTYGETYWEEHAQKSVWKQPLWELNCVARETGITAQCKQPQEVFEFLCLLYEDVDLTNALMWGEEGLDYEVNGNTAGRVGRAGEYIPCIYAGNQFIGHSEVYQEPNKDVVYRKKLEEMPVSKVSGFRFESKAVKAELDACLDVYREIAGNMEIFFEEYDTVVQKYKEAGVDKIIEEWNTQFHEWRQQ